MRGAPAEGGEKMGSRLRGRKREGEEGERDSRFRGASRDLPDSPALAQITPILTFPHRGGREKRGGGPRPNPAAVDSCFRRNDECGGRE